MSALLRTFVCLVLATAVAACQTVDPYTGETKTSNATKGALIGAAAVAAVGAISGDNNRERRKRAAIGAGIGALAGGAVGHYMDQQEAALREKLAGTGVSVTRKGDQVILNMPGNVTFDTNRSDVSASFYPVLDSVAEVLDEFDRTMVEVVGHTDSTGNDSINIPLSQRRAESVAAYLRSHEVDAVRLSTFGVGSSYPVATNGSPEGRSLNRRVEIALLPITG